MNTLKNTIRNIKHNSANAERIIAQYLHVPDDRTYSEDEMNLGVLYEDIADTEEFKMLKEFAIEGRSHLEMAMDRGITINACKKRLQRAKEKLRIKILE